MKNTLLIPAYNPSISLIKLIKSLSGRFAKIIVVDDGSISKDSKKVFKKIKTFTNTIILKHKKNLGKGQALKTGFKFCLKNLNLNYIITSDADGQHLYKDILKVSNNALKTNCDLVLGERKFDKHVPFKSLIGNFLTTKIFNFLYSSEIKDTQTGLRAYKKNIIKEILLLKGDRYELETNILIWIIKNKKKIFSVNISTIYINNNLNSHFSSIKDSAKIYFGLLGLPLIFFIFFVIIVIIAIICY